MYQWIHNENPLNPGEPGERTTYFGVDRNPNQMSYPAYWGDLLVLLKLWTELYHCNLLVYFYKENPPKSNRTNKTIFSLLQGICMDGSYRTWYSLCKSWCLKHFPDINSLMPYLSNHTCSCRMKHLLMKRPGLKTLLTLRAISTTLFLLRILIVPSKYFFFSLSFFLILSPSTSWTLIISLDMFMFSNNIAFLHCSY